MISKQFTTVTPLSKTIALILFIALPFIGFYLGEKYQRILDAQKSYSNGQIQCQTDADCGPNQMCVQAGPIAIDPVTKQPLNHKTCYQKGAAIPM